MELDTLDFVSGADLQAALRIDVRVGSSRQFPTPLIEEHLADGWELVLQNAHSARLRRLREH